MIIDSVLSTLARDLFGFLHLMDEEATTPSGCNSHSGLIDYFSYAGLEGKKYEESWNNRLAELLENDQSSTFREHRYPNQSRKKCDIVIRNNSTIWLEVKSAWKYWFSSVTGKREGIPSNYKGYFSGHGKKYSVAHDIEKLNMLSNQDADYVGLLIIGFDVADDPIDLDMEHLIAEKRLKENGWSIFGPETWPDRNHSHCRYNCWFIGKKVSN